MKEEFSKFCENIKLSSQQKEDAKTKYKGVCKKLHDSYYDKDYDGSTKYLFGSYKTKTNVRPLTEDQDVDVLFKIPQETFDKFDEYKSNGQSALLREVRNILKEKYTTTDKINGWGKIVLVQFEKGKHNVEVLPALEQEDGTFLIPNSEDDGSWDTFNPRNQVDEFQTSNETTNKLTEELGRMLKTWIRNTLSLKTKYKSYQLVNDIIAFLETEFENGADYEEYHEVVKNFFDWLKRNCDESVKSYVETAYSRAVKAIEFMDANKPKEASEEWIKIFGSEFPKVKENPKNKTENRAILTPSSPWCKLN